MYRAAYDERLVSSFNPEDRPPLATRIDHPAPGAASECWHAAPFFDSTMPIARGSAYLMGLQITGVAPHERWLEGRFVAVGLTTPGKFHTNALRGHSVAWMPNPFHPLHPLHSVAAVDGIAQHSAASQTATSSGHFGNDLSSTEIVASDAARLFQQTTRSLSL